ncbi:MAG: YcnI family protein [Alicyclobacillus sp.]|nr:YcnI family protein [Alicyclobacillus sp.]
MHRRSGVILSTHSSHRPARRCLSWLAGILLASAWTASTAWAHVVVTPATSTANAWEQYTMRVPTEKPQPTVKVVLTIPAGATFEQYEPLPGWTVSEQKDSTGRITTVIWTATNGGIAPGQFQDFHFIAKNPTQPGPLAWNAFQQYQDGTIVEWTGAPGTDTPHSITQVLAAASTGISPAGTANLTVPHTSPAAGETTVPPTHPWQTVAAVAALVLSVISLVLSLRARR